MKRIALVLLTLVLVTSACGDDDDGATEPEGKVVDLTAEDDGSRVEVQPGDRLVVTLDECVGCGYSWQVMGDLDPAVLELTDDEVTELPEREPGMVGGETTHVFTFTAGEAGEGTLAIGYVPPGEDAPEEVVTYEVRVAD